MARIAFWFGVDPWKLKHNQMVCLEENLFFMLAEYETMLRNAGQPFTIESVRRLTLILTDGDELQADIKAAEFGLEQARAESKANSFSGFGQ